MSSLLVVSSLGSEGAHAPEFRYLVSHCLLETRRVFDRVETVDPAGALATAPGFDAVLLLASERILIGRRTLAALAASIRMGSVEARPRPAATFLPDGSPDGSQPPIYTLRGFERLESRALDAPPSESAPTPTRLPVALLDAEWFQRLGAEVSVDRLLADPHAGRRLGPPDDRLTVAGLCHEFIDYYGEVRDDVLPYLPVGAREVLEVGCGRGATGALIQERLGCRVTGVELNPVVARDAARRLHRVVTGDVQSLELTGRFDAILALELVEHLVDAEGFLRRITGLLAPGGRAILSIPNVGHYSVVEDLVAGRWDYLPVGLLCYTHYRFFTRSTLTDWLERSGIERFELVPQRTEPPPEPRRFDGFAADLDSLSTKGFYVLIDQA
ncbi:MAG TPA: class I SAM-dependent methyltransferase [Thermoanaerobaculia bacterium]|nr:class I SAM-dependent methyltransferase [Thermoanaerobaculia bacterium]